MNNSPTLRIVRIVEGTSVDGPGLRTSLYFAGCRHECPGCHNPSTWPFDSGEDMTIDEVMKVIDYNRFNVTFTGGDPLYSAESIIPLARRIKDAGYTLWCYTGFTWEELMQAATPAQMELLGYVDVLVEGRFISALRDISLHFRGSSNQRIIDVAQSLTATAPVLYPVP